MGYRKAPRPIDRRQSKPQPPPGPPNPVKTPPGVAGQGCQIIFGHNADAQRVLMQFSVLAERLVFTPAEARDVASKLNFYADLADGKKTQA